MASQDGSALTSGLAVTSAVAGALAAAVLAAAATQVAANVTQPDETTANVSNVSQPNYAD